MKVGFTGTQRGMTIEQHNVLFKFLKSIGVDEFHHGDCIGADCEAASLVNDVSNKIKLHCHPPINNSKRAFTENLYKSVVYPKKGYLERNHDIVDMVHILIATPKEMDEELRSGTWATIRYARKIHKRIYIIYPDGSIKEEN